MRFTVRAASDGVWTSSSSRSAVVLVALAAFVMTLAAAAPPPIRVQQAPGPPGTGPAPSGIVLAQVVDAATGRPVPDAVVTVGQRGAGPNARGSATPPVTLLTGADGQFVARDLPAGQLTITAVADGYLPASLGQPRPNAAWRAPQLADGERLRDLKIRLWKPAAITGTVWDDGGDPAVGALVRVLRRTLSQGVAQYSPVANVKTDDRGMYRAPALVPGDYVVSLPETVTTVPASNVNSMLQSMSSGAGLGDLNSLASAAGMFNGSGATNGNFIVSSSSLTLPPPSGDGRQLAYATKFYPSAAQIADATVLTLASGEERAGVDFQVTLVPAVRVAGTIAGPPGVAAGAQVRLVPAAAADAGSDSGFEVGTAVADAAGQFTLLGIPSGQYVAKVEKRPAAPLPPALAGNPLTQMILGTPGAGSGQTVTYYAQTGVVVADRDVTGVALNLSEGQTVSGRIVFEGGTPSPADLQTVVVSLSPLDGRTPPVPPAHPDANGDFRVAGYPPGRYRFVVGTTAGAASPWTVQSALLGSRDLLDVPLDLGGADVGNVVVTYARRPPAEVSGTVLAPAGSTFEATVVLAFPADVRAWVAGGMSARRNRRAFAGQKGAYTLSGLPVGDYLIAALDDVDLSLLEDPRFFEALARVATRVSVAGGDRKTIDVAISAVPK